MKQSLPSAFVLWLGLGLLSQSGCAQAAKWELVAQNNTGFYYLDPGSAQSESDRKTVWTVLDYREMQSLRDGSRYRSSHAQMQFNCKSSQARIVHLSHYSGPMLGGALVQQQGLLQEWLDIESASPVQRIAARVCPRP